MPIPGDQRARLLGVQGLNELLVLEREHHLDDAGDAGRRLRVPQVGLGRAQVKRAVTPGAKHLGEGARLDRGSPSLVPVPWASIASMSRASDARRRAPRG